MFVMVISLILFSLLGWPNLFWRITSRLLLLPVVAGLSYELLRWAGRSDNIVVKVLSMPGLYLQKITTAEPGDEQLEVAIAAMKAVMVDPDTPCFEGLCDLEGRPLEKNAEAEEAGGTAVDCGAAATDDVAAVETGAAAIDNEADIESGAAATDSTEIDKKDN